MGVYSGPKISKNGLIFHYDMNNLIKSCKGAATTNIISPNGNNFLGWSNNAVTVTPNATETPDGRKNGSLLYVNSTGGSRSVNYGGYPANGSYTVYLKAANSTSCSVGIYTGAAWSSNGGCVILSGPGSGGGSGASTLYYITGLSQTEWTRVHLYSSSAGTVYIYPGGTGNTTGHSVYAYNGQVEALAIPSLYTYSSRSNTQEIIDLTNNHTVTANNLVYSSNGSFSFNGTSSNIVVPNSSLLKNSNITIELIMKNNGTMSGDIVQFGVGSGTYAQYYFRALGGNTFWDWFPTGVSNYGEVSVSNSSFGTGVWKHVVIIGTSSGSVKMFINGVSVGSPVLNATTSVGTWTPANLTIGGYSWDGFTTLSIASVKIYNRELSSQEIERNFEAIRNIYLI